MPCWWHCPGSVSYTHLDVYKRQDVYSHGGRKNVGLAFSIALLEGSAESLRIPGAILILVALLALSLIHI